MAYARLRKKWKILVWFVGIWLVFMFPIPFLPLFGVNIDENALDTSIIIGIIVTIPFTFLAVFMNDGNRGAGSGNASDTGDRE
ncbi:MAG TPA: hypothetical protein VH415_15090 [Nitrososphaeraceae archaeon]|jgi:hypothetical protein